MIISVLHMVFTEIQLSTLPSIDIYDGVQVSKIFDRYFHVMEGLVPDIMHNILIILVVTKTDLGLQCVSGVYALKGSTIILKTLLTE